MKKSKNKEFPRKERKKRRLNEGKYEDVKWSVEEIHGIAK